jgi:hypothetical protein
MAGVATASSQTGVSVVFRSWGFVEGLDVLAADEQTYDSDFTTPGVTFIASSGDHGAAVPQFPAFSPNVVAVDRTSLSGSTEVGVEDSESRRDRGRTRQAIPSRAVDAKAPSEIGPPNLKNEFG